MLGTKLPGNNLDFPKLGIDRENVCPFLLRCFYSSTRTSHTARDFNIKEDDGSTKQPSDEIQLYTWKNATLREISELFMEAVPCTRQKDSMILIRHVYPDRSGVYIFKSVGKVLTRNGLVTPSDDNSDVSLRQLQVEPGDFLDIHVVPSSKIMKKRKISHEVDYGHGGGVRRRRGGRQNRTIVHR